MNHNLLILGAGQYSCVVKEIAEAMNCFGKIDMLDDNNSNAVGKISDYKSLCNKYDYAVVAIGNNSTRLELVNNLIEAGFKVPSLIHPKAYISPSAEIDAGSIIEPFAVLQANVCLGKGCIISATAIVNHNAVIGDAVHCDCGAVISARSVIPAKYKVRCGAVYYAEKPDEGDYGFNYDYSAEIGI